MTVALLLAALLAILVVLVVALPFLREPDVPVERDELAGTSQAERSRLALLEDRDRALAALAELEFDHRTGKVSDVDYGAQVGSLRARAASALRALEPAPEEPQQPVPTGRVEVPTPPAPGEGDRPNAVSLSIPRNARRAAS